MDASDALILSLLAIADIAVLAYLRLRHRAPKRQRRMMRSLSLYLRRDGALDNRLAYPRRRVA
jgi:hypothetical protein